jgi:hypothetical protein
MRCVTVLLAAPMGEGVGCVASVQRDPLAATENLMVCQAVYSCWNFVDFRLHPYRNSYVRQVNKNNPPRFGTSHQRPLPHHARMWPSVRNLQITCIYCKPQTQTASAPTSYLLHDVGFHCAANLRIVSGDSTGAYGCLYFYMSWLGTSDLISCPYPSNFIYCVNSNMISFILDYYCFYHCLRAHYCECSLSSGVKWGGGT